MGLGDVSGSSVPKTALLAPPRDGGQVCTRSFIPVQPHTSIGVLAAVSVVTGMLLPGAVGARAHRGLAAPTARRSTSSTPPATCSSTSIVDGERRPRPGSSARASSAPPASSSTAPPSPRRVDIEMTS